MLGIPLDFRTSKNVPIEWEPMKNASTQSVKKYLGCIYRQGSQYAGVFFDGPEQYLQHIELINAIRKNDGETFLDRYQILEYNQDTRVSMIIMFGEYIPMNPYHHMIYPVNESLTISQLLDFYQAEDCKMALSDPDRQQLNRQKI